MILSFEEAVADAATGDIWLFRGRSLADRAIQAVTNSPVNHVGMVVALDDLPPLLWHAELGRSLPDVWTGQRQRGVQLHLLADAVRVWGERYGQRAWTRRLEGEIRREHEDRLMEVALEAGATDVRADGEVWTIDCDPGAFLAVQDALTAAGIAVADAALEMVPETRVALAGDKAESMMKLIGLLEDLDDVQNVYGNHDVPDEILERY